MKISEQQLDKVRAWWSKLTNHTLRAQAFFLRHTATDKHWIIILLLLVSFLRLPLLEHPNRTQFDEVIYTNFTLRTLHHEPFFDIHPPLARIIYTEIARQEKPFAIESLKMESGQSFGDFPYITLRTFTAIIGTLLPLLIYWIGRKLGYSARMAALPALFIIFDNAFIVYARVILPDTLLVLMNFLAFGCAYMAMKSDTRRRRIILTTLSGIAIGIALAMKWTALGVLATIWLLFLAYRRIVPIFVTGIIAGFIYLAVFIGFFFYFPQGGRADPLLFAFNAPWVNNIHFPKPDNIINVARFLPEIHRDMVRINNDTNMQQAILQAPSPLAWPVARTAIDFWKEDPTSNSGKTIILEANAVLWLLTFFLFLFEIGFIAWHLVVSRKWVIDRDETILLLGYLGNYLPFFLIHRPMYLYHYFTALIFLFLLVPKIAPRMIACITTLAKDKFFAKLFAGFLLLVIFMNFILLLPATYGF